MPQNLVTLDGNTSVADVAYRLSEVIAIYPITPSSSMGELSDEWATKHRPNLWGTVPNVTEMQSEGGAAGAVHGALQAGALSTTFTASQGLLLMIPNMFKIAGELLPFCMHVSARTIATHALSIFGDHSDVMGCRSTGFAMLCSGSVQEAHDLAAVSHMATLASRVPFLHFFDGFRTSSEVTKIACLSDSDLKSLIDEPTISAVRERALSPDHPVLRGSAQNPDTFFQAREAANLYYDACPASVKTAMDRFYKLTGRRYQLFDYSGHPEADRVIVMMGSGAETTDETVAWENARGAKLGVLKVRLFRPFSIEDFFAVLPKTVKAIAVLDRTKEPGALGEPLYQDIVTAFVQALTLGLWTGNLPKIVGGRYGLSSKEFTPAMVRAVFAELLKEKPLHGFTVGINDDITRRSLPYDSQFDLEPDDVVRAVFWGLGADGTVGANKSSIKIIGEETDRYPQGYFVYDSKKSGAITVSHVRFGPRPIQSEYLISRASFVAVHQWGFVERYDVLEHAMPGATLLLNSPLPAEQVWDALPREMQQEIIELNIDVYTIDAVTVARGAGMGGRINTVMQTCFFALAKIFPREEAIGYIKRSIEKTYKNKGPEVVKKNFAAVDESLSHLFKVPVPGRVTADHQRPPIVSAKAPDFVQRVTAMMLANKGDLLPVSAFPVDGTWPTGTAKWEKRNIALEIPVWDEKICIQCNKCAMVCPHAAVRVKTYDPAHLSNKPETFKTMTYKGSEFKGEGYTVQIAPEDCTGCSLCVEVCPAKDKANPRHKSLEMAPQAPIRAQESENYEFFLNLPEAKRTKVSLDVKGVQLFEPLFEYSGACSGCGETPYIKLATQLFGDRSIIANATGCSSIYGGNLPTTPYTTNRDGRGPAWANSLFEDNAEFGMGIRLAVDKHQEHASELLKSLASLVGDELVAALSTAQMHDEAGISAQRERVELLKAKLRASADPVAKRLLDIADYLVKKSVWIVGGDGWAYDIGFGGLDHVLASGKDVNILVLDTEVYSNTGGQQSKSTPKGAAAKFAAAGKEGQKKDLGMLAMTYGNVYIARIAFGAKDTQTVKAFEEADSYPGPSLIIAYSHCIAHGYDMAQGLAQQKRAVDTGYWPLYRFDPRRIAEGESPLKLDSNAPKGKLVEFARNETRFRMVEQQDPARFKALADSAQNDIHVRWATYENLAKAMTPVSSPKPEGAPKAEPQQASSTPRTEH
ncbi:MAG: pyruvate:ferredoxin (flavodoxin) oxidoreductase [Polyangiaceae bacterium]|nr:pyruvate:ferredoxin (flavodoxin) oxidoreductase [Polyangiaceae bacterium]